MSHFVHLVSHAPHGSSLSLVTCHPCSCAFLLEFDFLLFDFDLSFPVFFFPFHVLHFELHTELDNLIAMQNLRYSANKGMTTLMTSTPPSHMEDDSQLARIHEGSGGKRKQNPTGPGRQRNQGTCFPLLNLKNWRLENWPTLRSKATAKRLWIGSTAMQS